MSLAHYSLHNKQLRQFEVTAMVPSQSALYFIGCSCATIIMRVIEAETPKDAILFASQKPHCLSALLTSVSSWLAINCLLSCRTVISSSLVYNLLNDCLGRYRQLLCHILYFITKIYSKKCMQRWAALLKNVVPFNFHGCF